MKENLVRPFSNASFNAYLGENRLMASQCESCNNIFLPPRAICPTCFGENMSWTELSGHGKIAAFTTIYIGPAFMNAIGHNKDNPYMSGIVELDEGVRISARLLGFEDFKPEDVQIGTSVQVAFVRVGDGEEAKIQLAFRKDN